MIEDNKKERLNVQKSHAYFSFSRSLLRLSMLSFS
jgi:hypothetical protein